MHLRLVDDAAPQRRRRARCVSHTQGRSRATSADAEGRVTVSFTVIGIPAPQGSKTSWGTEANKNTRPWRAAVAAEASDAFHGMLRASPALEPVPIDGLGLIDVPVKVAALFVFPRPKSHFGTGRNKDVLKDSAPCWCATKPDADKLARAIGDALTGVLVRDDCLIVEWSIRKVYGSPARAQIDVSGAEEAA